MEPEHFSLEGALSEMDSGDAVPQSNAVDVGEEEDDQVIRARSRRLVSGYRFGNPPSPLTAPRGPRLGDEDSSTDVILTPSYESDSPPLTEPEPEILPRDTDIDVESEASRPMALPLEDSTPTRPLDAADRRRSERKRLDALTGLNDGEADEETSATRAEQGSESYLRGEAPYHFPKHRLRKTMKGKCFTCFD